MRIKGLLAAICLVSLSLTAALANGETIELEHASITLDLEELGDCTITKGESISTEHREPDFIYEITPLGIQIDGIDDLVAVEVHRMSTSEPLDGPISGKHQESGLEHCIERSYLVPVGEDLDTKAYEIDGQQGLIATVNEDGDDPQYIVAYSPDQENGSGSVVCIVASRLPWETTEELFRSIKTEVG